VPGVFPLFNTVQGADTYSAVGGLHTQILSAPPSPGRPGAVPLLPLAGQGQAMSEYVTRRLHCIYLQHPVSGWWSIATWSKDSHPIGNKYTCNIFDFSSF